MITEKGTRVMDEPHVREAIEDDYGFPWNAVEEDNEGGGIGITNKRGDVIAILDSAFYATRLVSACNATARYGTRELREERLVGNLLTRVCALQKLLDETLYIEGGNNKVVSCIVCRARKGARHVANKPCAILNPR